MTTLLDHAITVRDVAIGSAAMIVVGIATFLMLWGRNGFRGGRA